MSELKYQPISSAGWADYELLDSGNHRKLERFGSVILDRFEPDAHWEQSLPPGVWQRAHRKYNQGERNGVGDWKTLHVSPDQWMIDLDQLKIALTLSASRHVGIFPEQIENWRWMFETIRRGEKPCRVLNLFAYTGVASLYCALAGASVTHVEASRSAIESGKKSQAQSGLEGKTIRWIVDDAPKFVEREIRRGNHYDVIVLDPPQFGRGPKGEVWKFEQSIESLLNGLNQLLSQSPALFLLTAYNINFNEIELARLTGDMFSEQSRRLEYGPLIQTEKSAGHSLKQSIYVRQLFSHV